MTRKSKREIREMLMKQASQNTPDLWDKIESQLNDKPEQLPDMERKTTIRKPIYRYAAAGFAVLFVGAVAIAYAVKKLDVLSMQTSAVSSNFTSSHAASSTSSFDSSSVLFSSLRFPNSSKSLDLSRNAGAAVDSTVAFSEKNVITHSEIICKATVVDSNIKEYKYDTYSNKFEPNGRLHHTAKSIVYEIKIDDLYYNKMDVKVGDTIKVENYMSWESPDAILQQKHQYILNLHDCGDTILYDTSDYASGDIKRDGRYEISYLSAPQIEITLDQQYVFHDGWKSLINDKTIDIVWDKVSSSEQSNEYFANKMKLRQDKIFISDYKKMIAKYK